MNWAELRELLGSQKFASVEEIVAVLPEEMRRNYILQMASESPQFASPAQPRVILYSDDGKLMLAIGGGPEGQPTSPVIEAIEYDERTRTSKPHLIELKTSSALGSTPGVRIWENPADLYPAGHPRNCATCHGTPFRPIWDSYSLWPHSYGSGYRGWDEPRENKNWREFQNGNAKKGIYRHLPHADRAPIREMDAKNVELTHILNKQNEEKIFETIRYNPVVQRYRHEILAALVLYDRDEFAAHLSPEIREDFLAGQAQRREAIRAAILENDGRKARLFEKATGDRVDLEIQHLGDTGHVENLARIQYFMDRAGVSMADWPMTRVRGSYSFTDPTQLFQNLSLDFYRELVLPREPEWSHLVQLWVGSYQASLGNSDPPVRTFLEIPRTELTVSSEAGRTRPNLRKEVFQAMATGRSPHELLENEFSFLRPPAPAPVPPPAPCPQRMGNFWRRLIYRVTGLSP